MSALNLPEPWDRQPRPAMGSGSRGYLALGLELVGGRGVILPPAGRLHQGPIAVYLREVALFQAGLALQPPA